jgi:hypothetical protein
VATGESRLVPQPEGLKPTLSEWVTAGWFPDGTRFLANLTRFGLDAPNEPRSIWIASVLGGAPRLLRDNAEACAPSPDTAIFGR